MTNETAVRVYIHHSPDHHCGICPLNGCDVSLMHYVISTINWKFEM